MVADPLDDRLGAAVANAEPFAGDAADEDLAAGRPVEDDVAGDDILLGGKRRLPRRLDDDTPPREPLAAVIVDIPLDGHRHPRHAEGHHALAGGAGEVDANRAVGEPGGAVPAGDLTGEDRADGAVDVADRQVEDNGFALLDRSPAGWQERRHVERFGDPVVLRLDPVGLDVGRHLRLVEDRGEVEPLCLPLGDRRAGVETVDAPHHLLDGAEAELRHQIPQFFGEKEEEVDDMLRLAVEPGPQLGILRGDADRAGVEVALPHHDAADHDQRPGGDAELLGAEHRGDSDILGGADHAVGLDGDPAPQIVHDEHLMGLGEAELPRQAGVHDRRLRAGPGAAVVARDQDDVGFPLRDPRRHRPHADLRHELDADPGVVVGVLEVVDQLGEILDGVDVVMGRRRNQPHARRGVADAGDLTVDLVPRELPPLARLGPLGHLDLELLGVDEVQARDAEAAAGHLFDLRVLAVAGGIELVADRVLAPFAGVAPAAEPIHGDRERLVGLLRDRAVRHRAGGEALHNLPGRLNLLQRHRRRVGAEFEEPPQCQELRLLLVNELLILAELLPAVDLRRPLERGDDVGREDMLLPLPPPGVTAANIELEGLGHLVAGPGVLVAAEHLCGDPVQTDAADPARGAREKLVDERQIEADRLEDLRAAVALLRGDPHLAHHLQQPLRRRLDEVLMELLARVVGADDSLGPHLVERGEGEPGIDSPGPVAGQQGEVVHLACLARLDDEPAARPRPLANEMVVDASRGQQCRHDRHLSGSAAVGEDEDRDAVGDRLRRLGPQLIEPGTEAGGPGTGRVEEREGAGDEARPGRGANQRLDPGTLGICDHRRLQTQQPALLGAGVEEVPLTADRRDHRRDDLLTDGVERGIGDLREKLLEVVGQELRPVGEDRQRGVVAHRAERLGAVGCHRREDHFQILQRVAVEPLELEEARALPRHPGGMPGIDRPGRRAAGGGQLGLLNRTGGSHLADIGRFGEGIEADLTGADPFPPRLGGGKFPLDLVILDDSPLLGVDEEHLPGSEPPLANDVGGGELQHPGFAGHHHQAVLHLPPAPRPQPIAIERGANPGAVGES